MGLLKCLGEGEGECTRVVGGGASCRGDKVGEVREVGELLGER